jgi:hypothetical protein
LIEKISIQRPLDRRVGCGSIVEATVGVDIGHQEEQQLAECRIADFPVGIRTADVDGGNAIEQMLEQLLIISAVEAYELLTDVHQPGEDILEKILSLLVELPIALACVPLRTWNELPGVPFRSTRRRQW